MITRRLIVRYGCTIFAILLILNLAGNPSFSEQKQSAANISEGKKIIAEVNNKLKEFKDYIINVKAKTVEEYNELETLKDDFERIKGKIGMLQFWVEIAQGKSSGGGISDLSTIAPETGEERKLWKKAMEDAEFYDPYKFSSIDTKYEEEFWNLEREYINKLSKYLAAVLEKYKAKEELEEANRTIKGFRSKMRGCIKKLSESGKNLEETRKKMKALCNRIDKLEQKNLNKP